MADSTNPGRDSRHYDIVRHDDTDGCGYAEGWQYRDVSIWLGYKPRDCNMASQLSGTQQYYDATKTGGTDKDVSNLPG